MQILKPISRGLWMRKCDTDRAIAYLHSRLLKEKDDKRKALFSERIEYYEGERELILNQIASERLADAEYMKLSIF